jgi:ATP-binding cassette subfamily B protein
MAAELDRVLWPASAVAEALAALAREVGLPSGRAEAGLPPLPEQATDVSSAAFARWIEATAAWLGLEAEPVDTTYAEAGTMVRGAGPALLTVRAEHLGPRILCLLGPARWRRDAVEVLGPDLVRHAIPVEVVRHALCTAIEAHGRRLEGVLDRAGISGRRRARVERRLLRQLLGASRVSGCWLLRLPPGASFVAQLRQERLPRWLAAYLAAHLAHLAVTIGAWAMVGRSALGGRIDPAWLAAWALLLLTSVPLALAMSWSRGVFSIGLGRVLKARLLAGALQLRPSEIRHQGAGQLLGRVVESSAVGSLSLSAALSAAVCLIELVAAAWVLSHGAGGGLHVLLLAAWAAVTIALGLRYSRRFGAWTDWRLAMTNDLVERMVGHRTRLAQEPRATWHRGEDEALVRYLDLSGQLDRAMLQLTLVMSRGWLLVGLAGLAPAFVAGASLGPLAIGLGGVMLAGQALSTLSGSISSLTGAVVAWRQAKRLFHAAAQRSPVASPALIASRALEDAGDTSGVDGRVVIEADGVVYRHRDRGEPVLRGCSVRVHEGDRVLLEGRSGGGKSTLLSVLSGLRRPESGLVLVRGLDLQTLGDEGWRRLVATAPQFHENHVLCGTMAFNLLMGRRWPPTTADLEEAEALCRDLGLGNLLERMPSGLNQIVGETGWRLSHGERNRIFIARALLQDADLTMLDESFAALDPECLRQVMRCVLQRARTLLVVAHP